MARSLLFLTSLMISFTSIGNIRGGEFRYEHLSGYTYRIELLLYMPFTWPGDPPEAVISIDGDEVIAPGGVPVDFPEGNCGGTRMRAYAADYTFTGPGVHSMNYQGYNRPSGVINIPNSVNLSFCVSAQLIVSPLSGANHSPRFSNPQNYGDWIWSTWVHDPGAMDPDGDSLSFELVVPHGNGCESVLGYLFPFGVNLAWLDPATGVFHWSYPPLIGWWNLCIRASEWRNGVLIGQVTRDMMVCVDQIATDVHELDMTKPLTAIVSDHGTWLYLLGLGGDPRQVEVFTSLGSKVIESHMATGASMVPIAGLRSGAYIARVIERSGAVRQARFVLP
ncbi:MAG TPA: hypothetical protein PKY96_16540 [Flavobacteriales bacterium]|nr:hypothetical protein [Flavobacteriales bacterium]